MHRNGLPDDAPGWAVMPARPLCFGWRKWLNVFPKGMPCGECAHQWQCRVEGETLREWFKQEDRNAALLLVYARENHTLHQRCDFTYSEWVREEKVRERCVEITSELRAELAHLRAEVERLQSAATVSDNVAKAVANIGVRNLLDLSDRLNHARSKHPKFADNAEHASLVVREEADELYVAACTESPERQRDEALDVAATAVRFLSKEWEK